MIINEALRVNDTLYNVLDSNSGEWISMNKVTTWFDGSTMTDARVDGFIYAKIGTEYWRRNFTGNYNPAWFGIFPNTNADLTAKMNIAVNVINSLNGGTLHFNLGGTYFMGDVVMKKNVAIIGITGYNYTETVAQSAVTFKRIGSASCVLDYSSAQQTLLMDVEIDGNGGESFGGNGIKLQSPGSGMNSFQRVKIFHCDAGISGGQAGGQRIYNCLIRNNNVGLNYIKDSEISYTEFSGNLQKGIYLNNGQVRISNCFFEFTRNGTLSGDAITLDGNSSRITIVCCQFDRNGRNDIRIISGTTGSRPKRILIQGCQLKRAGWGTDITNTDRCAISVTNADGVTVVGNDFYFADYGAAGTEGLIGPRYAMKFDTCTEIVEKGNGYKGILNRYDFQSFFDNSYGFVRSPANSNEWYYKHLVGSGNPWLPQPDNLQSTAGAYMATGTLGSLAVNQWAWGDHDSLGYSTVYVRLTGDVDPNTISAGALVAFYEQAPVTYTTCTDVSTDEYRDVVSGSITAGSTISIKLNTSVVMGTFSRAYLKLALKGREVAGTVPKDCYYEIILKLLRQTGFPTLSFEDANGFDSDVPLYFSGTLTNGLKLTNFVTDGIGRVIGFDITYTSTDATSISYELKLKY